MPKTKSKVLFLVICSNTKTRGGESAYSPPHDITLSVLGKGKPASDVFACREKVRELITSDRLARNGTPLCELPYNKNLKPGPDFVLDRGIPRGTYLPAARRYRGRFYEKLEPDGAALLLNTPHHVLIVSGLYGLLTPAEPIQCYSCNITDSAELKRWWTENGLLTAALASYIKRFDIQKVLDFTAVDSYRSLIDWEKVRAEVGGGDRILHAFSNQLVGDAVLFPFGIVARRLLQAPEQTLMGMSADTIEKVPEYDVEVEFAHKIEPGPSDYDTETELPRIRLEYELTPEDIVVRMRVNLGRMVNVLSPCQGQDERFPDRVRYLKRRGLASGTVCREMESINAIRNLVLHEDYEIPDSRWLDLLSSYVLVETWAHKQPALAKLLYRPVPR